MNITTVSEAKNQNSINSTKKRDKISPTDINRKILDCRMVFDIDGMLPASTHHQYYNMEYNKEHIFLMNGEIST